MCHQALESHLIWFTKTNQELRGVWCWPDLGIRVKSKESKCLCEAHITNLTFNNNYNHMMKIKKILTHQRTQNTKQTHQLSTLKDKLEKTTLFMKFKYH